MSSPLRRAFVADHSIAKPDVIEADGAPTWITRGSNFVIAITRVSAQTSLSVQNVPDEHMVLLPDAGARVIAGNDTVDVPGNHLVISPPGNTNLVSEGAGYVVRCFSARATDLLRKAFNGGAFAELRGEVSPIVDWPEPSDGYRLRAYDLAAGLAEGDKTRVYRCSNLMINILRERHEPRDMRAMSPHSHEDFEQGSITLRGVHVHHLRTPWVPDMSTWRPDEAIEVGSPSVTVIPPPIIHTTRNVGEGPALLVDLFCPPRIDFSRRPGMVRNAADYPLPSHLGSE